MASFKQWNFTICLRSRTHVPTRFRPSFQHAEKASLRTRAQHRAPRWSQEACSFPPPTAPGAKSSSSAKWPAASWKRIPYLFNLKGRVKMKRKKDRKENGHFLSVGSVPERGPSCRQETGMHPGLPHGQQEPKHLDGYLLPSVISRCISSKLNWRHSNQDSKQALWWRMPVSQEAAYLAKLQHQSQKNLLEKGKTIKVD